MTIRASTITSIPEPATLHRAKKSVNVVGDSNSIAAASAEDTTRIMLSKTIHPFLREPHIGTVSKRIPSRNLRTHGDQYSEVYSEVFEGPNS